jgi:hypothetical protein
MEENGSAVKTYSLAEVAEMVLPEMTKGVRWLAHRLNRGDLAGYLVGRTWRMTHQDVEDLIERHQNRPRPRVEAQAPRGDFLPGLTPTSRRRLERGEL